MGDEAKDNRACRVKDNRNFQKVGQYSDLIRRNAKKPMIFDQRFEDWASRLLHKRGMYPISAWERMIVVSNLLIFGYTISAPPTTVSSADKDEQQQQQQQKKYVAEAM